MAVVVPESDSRVVEGVLVAQDTKGSSAHQAVARVAGGEADPARGHDAEEVGVPEQQDVPGRVAELRDQTIGAGADVRDRFAPRAAVAEEVPAPPLLADLGGPPPFVAEL